MAVLSRGTYDPNYDDFPLYIEGKVIQGFGRGSKQLGIPTANLPAEEYGSLLSNVPVGVYYGWANIDSGEVYEMAMSVGWNPFFKNTKKTIEVHLIHKFPSDFYGAHMRVIALGFIRPMCDFKSLDELIDGIKGDIEYAQQQLLLPANKLFAQHHFFHLEEQPSTP